MENICNTCPRQCNINRKKQVGFCNSNGLEVSKIMIHKWEEPLISGTNGSGTIFFSHCSLKCVYCQNYQISQLGHGKNISIEELAQKFKLLENKGVHNINLVSPTHFANEIMSALDIYKPNIPIVWNTSGYETVTTIKKLKNYVDIFLTDIKYIDENISQKYSSAKDYFEYTSKAVLQMKQNQPNDVIENNLMKKGVIVRHLVLPNFYKDSINILNWIKTNLGNKTFVSLMSQYTPCFNANKYPEINRKLKPIEYKRVLLTLEKLGFENGWTQELASANCKFIPEFENNDDLL